MKPIKSILSCYKSMDNVDVKLTVYRAVLDNTNRHATSLSTESYADFSRLLVHDILHFNVCCLCGCFDPQVNIVQQAVEY